MYIYNDNFCKLDSANKNSQNSKISKIFDFLNTTNSQTPYYKVIHEQNLEKSIAECKPLVETISKNFDNYIYIGMGGAILNPMMIYSLPVKVSHKKVYFLNTTDPSKFIEILNNIDLQKTAFITISNSGETSETISILGAIINEFKKANLDFSKNIFFCIGQGSNSLRKFAKEFNIPTVDYDVNVGGRFSCFSNASVLPAMLAGVDLKALTKGANKVVKDFWDNKASSKAVQSALCILATKEPNIVTISYSYHLDAFLEWYCQIISESLGKDNGGYTPLRGIGPQEQHSMLQLYLDGPKDKLYTLIYIDNKETACKPLVANSVFDGHFLETKPLTEIHRALFDATSQCLINNQLPLRTIELDKLNEENLGALIMHCSIEVIFLGLLMGLNPFDQPGVEAIKIEAKKILAA